MSDIDPNVIVDNERVDKADLRQQLQIAKNEITELQQRNSPARIMGYSDDPFGENDLANALIKAANLADVQSAAQAMWNLESGGTVRIVSGASFNMTSNIHTVIVDKTVSGIITINLPVVTMGSRITVVDGKGDAAFYNITLAADAILGGTTILIDTNDGYLNLMRSASKWILVG